MWALKDKAQETALCPSPHTYEAGFSSYSAEGLLQAQSKDTLNSILGLLLPLRVGGGTPIEAHGL